jgi:hypothetical protein
MGGIASAQPGDGGIRLTRRGRRTTHLRNPTDRRSLDDLDQKPGQCHTFALPARRV